MFRLPKILVKTIVLAAIIAPVYTYGQQISAGTSKNSLQRSFTIGFRVGNERNAGKIALGKPICFREYQSIMLRKNFTRHINVETGIKYNPTQTNTLVGTGNDKKYLSTAKSSFSVPLSIQYYFLQTKWRLQPYCGAGIQCNIGKQAPLMPPFASDIRLDNPVPTQTRYINVLITQGVSFQVSTRIQLTQSFHFMPDRTNPAMGMELGIGFNLD